MGRPPERTPQASTDAGAVVSRLAAEREGARALRGSLTHLAGIEPPASLDSFLTKHQFNHAQSTGLLDGHHRTEKRIDFAVDHAFRGNVAHGWEGHIEHIERHGRNDAKETVKEDRT